LTAAGVVLGVVLAAAVVVVVALPFLRDPAPADDRLDAPTPAEEQRLALAEERDRALGALKELEFDHRTGKITDEDYRRDVGPLRQRAAAALRRIGEPSDAVPEPRSDREERDVTDAQPVPEPAPPPDEGTPPTPAPVPEPYPPPDEITIPSPTPPQE